MAEKKLAESAASGGAGTWNRRWEDVERWIAFSDLHVSRRTIETCAKVLQKVHEEAMDRNAGVLFLGDFWHARGSLPVEPLNEVLDVFRSWTCPTIMISGNHDQVNIGGDVHALKPIEAASDFIKVIDQPTHFLGALFLPYRRNGGEIQESINSAARPKAIFAHVDVVGAHMNETFQAQDGIHPSCFPSNTPVYTGHYHKPHTVQGTAITYLGSPYQVSWNEAGQQKYLWLLDKDFHVSKKINIDIGPRHHLLSGPQHNFDSYRPGDRVRIQLESSMESTESFEPLRERGVHVEVVCKVPASPPRIEHAEQLGTKGLYYTFAETTSMSVDERQRGLDILELLSHQDQHLMIEQADVKFEKVILEGYGPFASRVEYALCNQSVRIVTGKNFDDPGCLSNGAGKTALVMAPMWALTGSTEARSVGGATASSLTNAEVVNDSTKYASVELHGTINGRSFYLKRQVGRRTLKALQFVYDGEDLTCQESKLTQAKIDELFNTGLLTKIVFHGQHTVEKLLGSRDKEFKDELGQLVALDLWEAAKNYTSNQVRLCKVAIDKLSTELEVLERNRAGFLAKVDEAHQHHVNWEQEVQQNLKVLEDQLNRANAELQQLAVECSAALLHYNNCKEEIEFSRLGSFAPMEDSTVDDLQQRISQLELELNNLKEEAMYSRAKIDSLRAVSASQWERLKGLHNMFSGEEAVTCSQCMQPISETAFDHASSTFEHEAEQAEQAVVDVQQRSQELAGSQKVIEGEIKRCKEDLRRQREQQESLAKEHQQRWVLRQKAMMSADLLAEKGGKLLESLQKRGEYCSADSLPKSTDNFDFDTLMAHVVRSVDRLESKHGQYSDLQRQVQSLGAAESPHKEKLLSLESLLKESEESIHNVTTQKGEMEKELGILSAVDLSFSRTGIQNFLLEGVLQELQLKTANFLELLSSGALRLILNPTRPSKSKQGATLERIDKTVEVWAKSGFVSRSLKSLSGGEQRRVALALSLAFSELGSERSNTRSNMLVLDEPFQHLDLEGCQRATTLLKSLQFRTILLVSQAYDSGTAGIERADCVVKRDGVSSIESF
eukprot:CAMPEP_0183827234 /NCGR_PEP_ID=MMETSP0807_2-20130328/2138_1 /TAXON_ID=88271 /ORGANISM="Picocystis salinarum, Strain CCMP1897" /LENGTH=1066 /DNA_ID=CAMNT_0026072391 /DNA_START=63 /DNA_END=3263 /DNA_ORIENTATION=-